VLTLHMTHILLIGLMLYGQNFSKSNLIYK